MLSLLLYELTLPFIVVQAALLIAWRFHERGGKGLGWITASIPQLLAIAARGAPSAPTRAMSATGSAAFISTAG